VTLIVDASVAVKWFLEEIDHVAARAVLDSHDALIAPSIVLAELGNAVWKRHRRGAITKKAANRIFSLMARPFATLIPIETLAVEAAELALNLNHPIYDCFYLALAARERTPIATADGRLAALARRIGIDVQGIGKASLGGLQDR
jgi:predicted nucleic acid-binding protein